MIRDRAELLRRVLVLQARLRDEVLAACREQSVEQLAAYDDSVPGDTAFAVDRVAEEVLVALATSLLAAEWPLLLVAEGLSDTGLGHGVRRLGVGEPEIRVVVDPLDGTRLLAHQKRSAWVLTGVAPQLPGPAVPRLRDVELAAMTEVPTVKAGWADVLWAVRGQGARGERVALDAGAAPSGGAPATRPLAVRASAAQGVEHGFLEVARYFPGGRDVLAAVEDGIARRVLGPPRGGKAQWVEDQYCTGGTLAELATGHDRFAADLRPLLRAPLSARGEVPPICAHPYDVCATLVAEEAGVVVVDPASGAALDCPLTVEGDVAWAAYCNPAVRALVEPALQAELRAHGLAR